MNVSDMVVIKYYKSFALFLCLIFVIFHIASSTVCSASDNEKWNKKRNKCVECPKCPPGHFRNLTEPYTRRTGEHGAERCIKCKPCPEGTYSKGGYGDCMRCRINCTDFYRETDEACSSLHDAKCGSCLSGFEDIFKNTGFPCAPKRSLRMLDTPKQTNKKSELSDTKSDDKPQVEVSIAYGSDKKTKLPTDAVMKSSEEKCSTSERWSSIKKRCVPCSKCPPGHFRNHTELYTGPEVRGNERCPRCRPCPDGTYSENGLGECNRCRVNCTEMKREYDEFCSKVHDSKCGSCLYGYEDAFGHTLFPCSPKKAVRLIKPPKDPSLELNDPERTIEGEQKHSVPTDKHNGADNSSMVIIFGLVVFVLIVSISVAFLIKRKRNRTEQNGVSDLQGSYSRVNMDSCTHDTDIEVDAVHADDTCALPGSMRNGDVSGCLEPRITKHLGARPEMPRHTSTVEHCNGMFYVQLSDGSGGPYIRQYERKQDICKCRDVTLCHCLSYNLPKHEMEKSDEYITVVASEICHDPFPLFRALGLKDPIIYQEDNSRERDPVNISQKELVMNLLNRWIEVKSTPTNIQHLSVALCQADFHHINDKLYNKCMKTYP